MSTHVTPRTLAMILAATVAVLAVGGWFGLVASQRSSASSLDAQVEDAKANLAALEVVPTKTGHKGTTKGAAKAAQNRASQLEQLEAAFPKAVDMPSILLQIQKLATQSKVSLQSFAPSLPTPSSGYDVVQLNVTVSGRYRDIQRFVHALRVQATSTRGRIHATGRLFAVDTVGISAATEGLPALNATIQLDAFVYSGVVPATESGNSVDGGDGSTTTTTSEGTSP